MTLDGCETIAKAFVVWFDVKGLKMKEGNFSAESFDDDALRRDANL